MTARRRERDGLFVDVAADKARVAPAAIVANHGSTMYGLVNKAIEELVSTRFGEETWAKIRERAGIEVGGFMSMDPYPDAVTYRMVFAASEVLGVPVASLLEAFGEYWMLYTAREGYGELITMFGSSLGEFLGNLDNMHTRVGLSFPELQPPSFVARELGPDRYALEYHSTRDGLAPMVVGLLKGLARSFGESVEVVHAHARATHGYDLFHLQVGRGAAAE